MERSMFVDEVQAELDRERYSNNPAVNWARVGCLTICLISAILMGFGIYGILQVL